MTYLINYLILFYIKTINWLHRIFLKLSPRFNCKSLLERNFKVGSSFNFIQIGANDGISFDTLYDFVVNRKSKGIVVEPIKEYFEELCLNYKEYSKIETINLAVHDNLKEISLFKLKNTELYKYPEWAKGIASFDFQHLKKHNIESEDIEKVTVEAKDLMKIIGSIIEKNDIDYFQIDTEGYDYSVIKMIDFNKVFPKILKYENVNLSSEEKKACKSLLESKGYFVFNDFNDTIGVDLKRIKLF